MKPKISRRYNVPFLAGYNMDGTVIYIDSRLPKTIPGTTIKTERYLLAHEITEERLEETMGLSYADAHRIATVAEHTLLAIDGYKGEDRKAYDEFYVEWIKICRDSFTSIPQDLDIDPYVQSKEKELLDKMKKIEPKLLWKGK